MTLGELIEVLGGKLVQGDPEMPILFVRDPTEANPWDLVFAEDAASAAKAFAGGASAVVLKPGCADPRSWDPDMCVVETNQPRLWFAKAGKLLKSVPPAEGVHPTAVIGERVELGVGRRKERSAVLTRERGRKRACRERGVVLGEARVRLGHVIRERMSLEHTGVPRARIVDVTLLARNSSAEVLGASSCRPVLVIR